MNLPAGTGGTGQLYCSNIAVENCTGSPVILQTAGFMWSNIMFNNFYIKGTSATEPVVKIDAVATNLLFGIQFCNGEIKTDNTLYTGGVFTINNVTNVQFTGVHWLSLIHISEPTRPCGTSRMPSSA